MKFIWLLTQTRLFKPYLITSHFDSEKNKTLNFGKK